MFDSSAAIAALANKNHVQDWAALNPQTTGMLLQQTERDKQAANLAMAQTALVGSAEMKKTKAILDYNKWELKERLKANKNDNSQRMLALLGSLGSFGGGGGFAGNRMGISPANLGRASATSLLQEMNAMASGLGTFGDSSADYASNLAQALQYVPGMRRSSQ